MAIVDLGTVGMHHCRRLDRSMESIGVSLRAVPRLRSHLIHVRKFTTPKPLRPVLPMPSQIRMLLDLGQRLINRIALLPNSLAGIVRPILLLVVSTGMMGVYPRVNMVRILGPNLIE